jgi:hypothetical protein
VCRHCGKDFYRIPSYRAVLCSPECARAAMRGKGGRFYDQSGYVHLTLPDGTQVLEHRYVMERHLGRTLEAEEIVHHRNEVRDDNRIENLQVLDRSAHNTLHNHARRTYAWSRNYPACIACGTTTLRYGANGLCITCSVRALRAKRKQSVSTP